MATNSKLAPPTVEEDVDVKKAETEAPKPTIKLWAVSVDCMLDFDGIYSIIVAKPRPDAVDKLGNPDEMARIKHVKFWWKDGREINVPYNSLLPGFQQWLIEQGITK